MSTPTRRVTYLEFRREYRSEEQLQRRVYGHSSHTNMRGTSGRSLQYLADDKIMKAAFATIPDTNLLSGRTTRSAAVPKAGNHATLTASQQDSDMQAEIELQSFLETQQAEAFGSQTVQKQLEVSTRDYTTTPSSSTPDSSSGNIFIGLAKELDVAKTPCVTLEHFLGMVFLFFVLYGLYLIRAKQHSSSSRNFYANQFFAAADVVYKESDNFTLDGEESENNLYAADQGYSTEEEEMHPKNLDAFSKKKHLSSRGNAWI
ncbi:unnamed protein product [Amoebophrya sp. A120]|nr:unnamed protein product [Amoebophrya sp. A120]|eukprot:GSA120T00010391001.1